MMMMMMMMMMMTTTAAAAAAATTGKYCSVAFIRNFRISSTDSTVKTSLYSIMNSTKEKFCSVASYLNHMATLLDFTHRLQSESNIVPT